MAENALSPAFTRINYHSAYGIHVMTVPTVSYIPPDVGNVSGQFDLRGAALPTSAGDAIEDYVNLLKPFMPESVLFDNYIIYTQDSPTAPPTPRYAGNLNIAGTNVSAAWSKAVQFTWTFRTTAFGLFKIVLLDAASAGTFDKIITYADPSPYKALVDYVTAETSFLSGRDDERPATFLQLSKTLNEKLRRAYNMN